MSSRSAPPVVVIGLDSAERSKIETWAREGHLPQFARRMAEGASCRLRNPGPYGAEAGWTTLLTGCEPARTGYWTDLRFIPADYSIRHVGTYPFRDIPPFYALGPDYRMAIFDVPQAEVVDGVHGAQVLAWGAHSALAAAASRPPDLIHDIERRFGSHPAMNRDHASFWNPVAKRWLARALAAGIRRRADICRHLLERERWDLFFTVFGEVHAGGHYFWHLTDEEHPLHRGVRSGKDPVLEIYRETDRAIGRILAAAPRDASVVLFSQEGMRSNAADLPSILFLPELLFRYSFPGEVGLAWQPPGTPLPPPFTRPRSLAWYRDVYARRHDATGARRRMRYWLPIEATALWERASGTTRGPAYPKSCGDLFYQPPMWYRDLWPHMTCFALPSFSDGYVRLNLAGREPGGRVEEADYSRVCEEVRSVIEDLRDARTKKPIVREILRTRRSPGETDPRLPDADLVVVWNEVVTDVVEHPRLGRIGPVPYGRTGGHSDAGFAIVSGPGFPPRRQMPDGTVLDLAPTILDLMGAPRHEWLEGSSLDAGDGYA